MDTNGVSASPTAVTDVAVDPTSMHNMLLVMLVILAFMIMWHVADMYWSVYHDERYDYLHSYELEDDDDKEEEDSQTSSGKGERR